MTKGIHHEPQHRTRTQNKTWILQHRINVVIQEDHDNVVIPAHGQAAAAALSICVWVSGWLTLSIARTDLCIKHSPFALKGNRALLLLHKTRSRTTWLLTRLEVKTVYCANSQLSSSLNPFESVSSSAAIRPWMKDNDQIARSCILYLHCLTRLPIW